MKPNNPNRVYLKDYQPPHYWIEQVHLDFYLDPQATRVVSTMTLRANEAYGQDTQPLLLDGEQLELLSVKINGRDLTNSEYEITAETLCIPMVPRHFELSIETRINPEANTALQGLYRSSGNYCTQCEAMGFRHITYYLDRPDVLARFSTRIEANKQDCPVMLSNGNRVDQGELENGRHWVLWQDPFPKAAYLFALVAGDLVCIADKFTTRSGREVDLHIYVEQENADKCDHAMRSLQKAMLWDEQTFGLEYDLDIYMIVAVNDFNMGAMENKGLNVFNSKYVLAKQNTATDQDFQAIEAVIGHEYFHNWTGNRVTLRDWFQLSLKEGLTVFRDQEFSADQGSRAVKRIDDVKIMRTAQFAEDASPMAHPIRPESYIEMNNFYTVTVYNKGAEVIRMLHTLLGAAGFRKGMDLYFARHDGYAVTTDDFVAAMEDANDRDLTQFRLWYQQAGTPTVAVQWQYSAATQTMQFNFTQTVPATPGQAEKQAMHIPIRLALLSHAGEALTFVPPGAETAVKDWVFELQQASQVLELNHVAEPAIPSLLRGFSAPVRLTAPIGVEDRKILLRSDTDAFNQWDASVNLLLAEIAALKQERKHSIDSSMLQAFVDLITDEQRDPALIALMCSVPSLNYLLELEPKIDIDANWQARQLLVTALVKHATAAAAQRYQALARPTAYDLSAGAIAARSLKNTCLSLLTQTGDSEYFAWARTQYEQAQNMTDRLAAVRALLNSEYPDIEAVLGHFYEQWHHDPLVMDKWLAVQATAERADALARVMALHSHPVFDLKNPNKVYALLNAFARNNPYAFHSINGEAYRFIANQVLEIDAINHQVAGRLVSAFTSVGRMDAVRASLMTREIERMLAAPKLSKDVYEILVRTQGAS